jgi:ubiquinone/menaquinone biosynthesis C-methylase UbiE
MPPTPLEPHKDEPQSTYFVQDRRNQDEHTRLTIQDRMLTTSMGGVLPEQPDPTIFRRVLDVGCGTGGWAIEAARAYPTMSLIGIDINEQMIAYARERANAEQVAERVEFRVMDAMRRLEFPQASFDLVNMRLAVGYVRSGDWPNLIREFQGITRHQGTIRLTEADIAQNNSPALTHLNLLLRQAFYNAGTFFALQDDGLTSHLASLLTQYGLENVQTQEHTFIYRAGTPGGQHFVQDMQHLYRTVQPFIQRWTSMLDDYDEIYQQALIEMQQADFIASWRFVTAWGSVVASE